MIVNGINRYIIHVYYELLHRVSSSQVTGDNVRSLVLCDFTGDGKNEVGFVCYDCMITCSVRLGSLFLIFYQLIVVL